MLAAAFRVTTYEIRPGQFSGTSYVLDLAQALSANYFPMVIGAGNGANLGPDVCGARVVADPFGTGDLAPSGAAGRLLLQRGAAGADWVGTVTVVECIGDPEGNGFTLLDVADTALPGGAPVGAEQSITDTCAGWDDLDRVVVFGGLRGGGGETASALAGQHPTLHVGVWPSGPNQLNFSRWNDASGSLAPAAITSYVVKFGSRWRVQRATVTGTAGGAGADQPAHYDTQSLSVSVVRAHTWAWMSGWTKGIAVGDSFSGLLLALGSGVAQSATESRVAVGCEMAVDKTVRVAVLSHTQAAVDWVFKPSGDGLALTVDLTVDAAVGAESYATVAGVDRTVGSRFGLATTGAVGTGLGYPRTTAFARHRASTTLRASRNDAGLAFTAWSQSVDLADILYLSAATASDLDDPATREVCACDEGDEDDEITNEPGQSDIDYRVSTWAMARDRMMAALATQEIADGDNSGTRPMRALGTRDTADPTIALFDAFAMVTEVLSFYQERIANEGFLRTAKERMSIVQLARQIGYELNPGVAASTWVAFTALDVDTVPDEIEVPEGTQVMSTPLSKDETAQTFETSAALTVRKAQNAMTPVLTKVQDLDAITGTKDTWSLVFSGTGLGLQVGNRFLLVASEWDVTTNSGAYQVLRASSVEEDYQGGTTTVGFDRVIYFTSASTRTGVTVHVFRASSGAFGQDAPDFKALPDEIQDHYGTSATEWPDIENVWTDDTLPLNAELSQVLPDTWMYEQASSEQAARLHAITEVDKAGVTGFALSRTVTKVTVSTTVTNPGTDGAYRREAIFHLQSEALTLAELPITDEVSGDIVTIDGAIADLSVGQSVAVSGTTTTGEDAAEVATIADVSEDADGNTVLTFEVALTYTYERDTVAINGNVVEATHGRSVEETLGSGDGSKADQRFAISGSPLTYVSAATVSGSASTLELRVDGVKWEGTDSFYEAEAADEVYVVQQDEEHLSTVVFGDGLQGARLPTGKQNVVASYRVGLGVDANLDAGRLTVCPSPPPGIQSVTNPVDATGGEDPEGLEDARTNAPLTVRTLDRLVSLTDFEDFSRAFAGIGKARATELVHGGVGTVYVTVLDSSFDEIADGDAVYDNLVAAIAEYGDPSGPVFVGSQAPVKFTLTASILVDDAYEYDAVVAAVEDALLEAFDVSARDFVRPVTAAEIVQVMHGVAGVIAVDIDSLARAGGSAVTDGLASILEANDATSEDGVLTPAEVLVIDPDGIALTEMSG